MNPNNYDLECKITFNIRFQVGCTKLTFDTLYRGLAKIEEGGVTGDVEPSHVFPKGQLGDYNKAATRFNSRNGDNFLREDTPSGEITVSTPREQVTQYESHTRLRVVADGPDVVGVVYMDPIDLHLANQQIC